MRAAARPRQFPVVPAAHDDGISCHEEDHGGDPRNGIGGADARKSPDTHEHERGKDAPRELRDARKRCDGAPADPLQRIAIDVDRTEEGIEGTLPQQELPAVADDRAVVARDVCAQIGIQKELHERFAQPDGKGKSDDRARKHIYHAREHAPADAPELPRAVVLPRISGERRSERDEYLVGDVIDL